MQLNTFTRKRWKTVFLPAISLPTQHKIIEHKKKLNILYVKEGCLSFHQGVCISAENGPAIIY